MANIKEMEMEMEINSKYYNEFTENMNKYDIPVEAYDNATGFQMLDEMMFAFNMFLLI